VALRVAGWLAGGIVVFLSMRFLAPEALPYLMHVDPILYGRYWPRRGWLLVHVVAGSLALLLGPVQLLANLWLRRVSAHRWIGRSYLAAVIICGFTACYLSVFDPAGRVFMIAFQTLAVVWMGSAVMAYMAIRRGQVMMHQDWLLRSYVLGYTVVTFRLVVELPWFLYTGREEELTIGWLSWTVPLFITELALSGRRFRSRLEGETRRG